MADGLDTQPLTTNSSKLKNRTHWGVIAVMLFSLVSGFIGGALALRLYDQPVDLSNSETRQAVVTNESEVISSIAQKVSPSVVSITVETPSASSFFGQFLTQESAGTGLVIDENGLIMTNRHVIPVNAQKVSVVTSDGKVYEDVEVVDRDQLNDIAFLQIKDPENLLPAQLGDSDKMQVGDKVIAIGNALGEFNNTVTTGIISGIGRPIVAGDGLESEQLSNLFQTDAAINPGNSGGPLVNINGEVIGINTAVAGGAENIGFSIPINDTKALISSVQKAGKIIRPYLGVRYVTLNQSIAKELEVSSNQGALITSQSANAVIKNSPAEKAGLKAGDIILKVNTDELSQDIQLVTLISRYQVGDTVTLTILRDDQEQTLQVTLEAIPDSL